MNLLAKQSYFWPWFFKVLTVFFKARPLTTAAVIVTTISGQVTKFLSMILPLKVILLAGSEGVPGYFEFFISPENKDLWIVIFLVSIVTLFLVNYLLDNLSQRLAQSASGEIIETANEITLLADQERKATSYYARFCSVVSSFLFVSFSMLIIFLVNTPLFIYWLLAVVVVSAVTFFVIIGRDDITPTRTKAYVLSKTNHYLSGCKVVIFLFGFFVILYPFVFGEGFNVLIGIVSLILFRQSLNMLNAFVGDAVGLGKAQHRINPLIFRDHHLEHKEHIQSVAIREVFSREKRLDLVSQKLKGSIIKPASVEWLDSGVPGAKTFLVTTQLKEKEKFYQLQVFPQSRLHNLNNEAFLFENISPQRLSAPCLLARFDVGVFECLAYDYGAGEALSGPEWKKCQRDLFVDILACQPPVSLIESYTAAHPMLHNRFKNDYVDRVIVGIDTHEEEAVLKDFRKMVPFLKKYVKQIPLYVYNPDINPRNVVKKETGDGYLIMTWSRWKLLPLGAAIPARYHNDLTDILSSLKDKRKDIHDGLTSRDMLLVYSCYELDKAIHGERYKAALLEMKNIISFQDLFLPSRSFQESNEKM